MGKIEDDVVRDFLRRLNNDDKISGTLAAAVQQLIEARSVPKPNAIVGLIEADTE